MFRTEIDFSVLFCLGCMFLLNPKRSKADIIKNVKGSTSHFINHFIKPEEKFEWQHGYGSSSISESEL